MSDTLPQHGHGY